MILRNNAFSLFFDFKLATVYKFIVKVLLQSIGAWVWTIATCIIKWFSYFLIGNKFLPEYFIIACPRPIGCCFFKIQTIFHSRGGNFTIWAPQNKIHRNFMSITLTGIGKLRHKIQYMRFSHGYELFSCYCTIGNIVALPRLFMLFPQLFCIYPQ